MEVNRSNMSDLVKTFNRELPEAESFGESDTEEVESDEKNKQRDDREKKDLKESGKNKQRDEKKRFRKKGKE